MSAADHEAEAALILAAESSPASVDRANAHTRLALSIRAGEIAGALRGIAEALGSGHGNFAETLGQASVRTMGERR